MCVCVSLQVEFIQDDVIFVSSTAFLDLFSQFADFGERVVATDCVIAFGDESKCGRGDVLLTWTTWDRVKGGFSRIVEDSV